MFSDELAPRIESTITLASHTTLGVGGPAEYYFEAKSADDVVLAMAEARAQGIPVTILGAGSNVLVADSGVKGLVIVNQAQGWTVLNEENTEIKKGNDGSRWKTVKAVDYEAYKEEEYPPVFVRAEAGSLLSRLMLELLPQGITGLEWFAGIPGTVGGAIYMNMHGGREFFGDRVHGATLLTKDGAVKQVTQSYFQFRYDWSILHSTKEIVLDATLGLRRGPVDKARVHMQQWMKHKNETQPKKSCGSVFQNLRAEEQERLGLPTDSAGYIIDKLLDLNGTTIGGAKIHDLNGNFMVNTGAARAEDFAILIAAVKEKARNKLGLELHEEVEYVGF